MNPPIISGVEYGHYLGLPAGNAVPCDLIIRNAVAAGAEYDETGLSPHDRYWLEHCLQLLQECEIPVANDFNIIPLNIVEGFSFFDVQTHVFPERNIDLSMLCYIYNPRDSISAEADRVKKPTKLLVDERHFQDAIWPQSAESINSKVIIIVSSPFSPYGIEYTQEVTAAHFKGSNYIVGPSRIVRAPSRTGCKYSIEEIEKAEQDLEALRRDLQMSPLLADAEAGRYLIDSCSFFAAGHGWIKPELRNHYRVAESWRVTHFKIEMLFHKRTAEEICRLAGSNPREKWIQDLSNLIRLK